MVFRRLTMPMYRNINTQFVLNKDFDFVSLINFNQRTWLLTIDQIDLTRDTICIKSVLLWSSSATLCMFPEQRGQKRTWCLYTIMSSEIILSERCQGDLSEGE